MLIHKNNVLMSIEKKHWGNTEWNAGSTLQREVELYMIPKTVDRIQKHGWVG